MPDRVLVLINTLNVGGAETFIMKVLRSVDRERLVFDFLINDTNEGFYEKEVLSLGGKVFHGYFKVNNPFKNLSSIYKTVKGGGYKKAFVFTQHPIAFLDLLMVTIGGARVRVVRSTNSDCGGKVSNILAFFFRPLMNLLVTKAVAPSKEAGVWLFGRSVVKNNHLLILNNGVRLSDYAFNQRFRDDIRKALGIRKEEIVIGHVGRFNTQKNHEKLIRVFKSITEFTDNCRLVLVGDGELRPSIENMAIDLGVKEKVLFLGVRSDVPSLLSAFDVKVFPSLYEGMPNTIIEAQAADLPCLLSDTITREAKVLNEVKYLPLDAPDEMWAKEAMELVKKERVDNTKKMEEAGYSIGKVVNDIYSLFGVVG